MNASEKEIRPVQHPSFPPVPDSLTSRNPLGYLKYFGPGAILASVTVGGGETVFASRGGAIFEYSLLWCFVLGAVLKGVQVHSGSRFMTLTGTHPVYCWAQMRGPRAWFPILLVSVSFLILPGMFSALPKFLASLLTQLLHIDALSPQYGLTVNLLASAVLIFCVLLALGSTYRLLELLQIGVVLIFLLFVFFAFLVFRPDLSILLGSLFSPSIPEYPSWVAQRYPKIANRSTWVEVMTYIGIIGGSSNDYLGYLSFLRDKKWGRISGLRSTVGVVTPLAEPSDEERKVARFWLRAPLCDVLVSFGSVTLLTIVFVVLGATVLYPQQLVPDDAEILTVQSAFLTRLHPGLYPFYIVGIIAVFLGTIYGGVEVQTRALTECGRAIFPALAKTPVRKFRWFIVGFVLSSGLLLIWTGWDSVAIFTPASILGGVFACGLWCFAMLWTDRRFLPEVFRMGRVVRLWLWLAGFILTFAGIRAFYDYFL